MNESRARAATLDGISQSAAQGVGRFSQTRREVGAGRVGPGLARVAVGEFGGRVSGVCGELAG